MNVQAACLIAVVGLAAGGFVAVATDDSPSGDVVAVTSPSTTAVLANPTETPRATESAASIPTTQSLEVTPTTPTSAAGATPTTGNEPSAMCNPIAVDRVGSPLASIMLRRSVSFVVEICQSSDGRSWYHGARLWGDPAADSITLEAVETSPGVFESTNNGWSYRMTATRISITSPDGLPALDQPLRPESAWPTADSERQAILLVDVANLRTEPKLSSRSISRISGLEGASMAVFGASVNGWYEVEIAGTRGWIFGAFAAPPDEGLSIARTIDEEEAVLLDATGRRLGLENASGSYVLVLDSAGPLWQVILPDGAAAFVDPSLMRIVQ